VGVRWRLNLTFIGINPCRAASKRALGCSCQPRITPTAKPEKVCPIQLFLKVAAPWGRGDLSAAASGYSISGFAIGRSANNGRHASQHSLPLPVRQRAAKRSPSEILSDGWLFPFFQLGPDGAEACKPRLATQEDGLVLPRGRIAVVHIPDNGDLVEVPPCACDRG